MTPSLLQEINSLADFNVYTGDELIRCDTFFHTMHLKKYIDNPLNIFDIQLF